MSLILIIKNMNFKRNLTETFFNNNKEGSIHAQIIFLILVLYLFSGKSK